MKLLGNLLCLTIKYVNADPKAKIRKKVVTAYEIMLAVSMVTGNDDTSKKINFLLITLNCLKFN